MAHSKAASSDLKGMCDATAALCQIIRFSQRYVPYLSIVSYSNRCSVRCRPYYKIRYEDGDEEEMTSKDVADHAAEEDEHEPCNSRDTHEIETSVVVEPERWSA
jgi:hypothetical protein